MKGRLYHESAMSTTSPRVAADHAAGRGVHGSAVVRARDGARVRADVAGRRPGAGARPAGRVHPARRRRRERADRARGRRIDRGVSQRVPPSRHAAVHRGTRTRSRAASSARITRGPTGSTAACWPRRRWTRSPASIDRSIRCAASPARRGTATSSSTWPTHPRRCARSSRDLPARFAPWRMQELRLRAPDRVRHRDQLEAGGAELQRVPALPDHPSAAEPDAPLPGRRQRADHRDLLRRRHGLQGRRRDAQLRRQAPARRFCRASASASARW